MAVAYRVGTNANDGQTTTSGAVNFTVPGTAQVDDVAIVTIEIASSVSGAVTSAPSGWTQLDTVAINSATSWVYWKRLVSGDISAAANWTITTGRTIGIMDIFIGVDTVTAIEANTKATSGTAATTLTGVAVTSLTTDAGIYNVWLGRRSGGTFTITKPASHTAGQSAVTAYTGAVVNGAMCGAYLTAASGAAGSKGPYSATASVGATKHTYSLALKPSVAATAITQAAYRLYEDGTESGSTAIAAQDTSITRTVSADSNLALRMRLQETGGVAGISTDDYQLQYSQNGGAYTNVGSGAVTAYASANLTDGGATTNRLGAGTGSFVAGEVSETGLVTDHTLTASNYTEHLYSLTLVSSALAHNDTLDFRVLRNGAVINTYTVTPRITVSNSPYTLVQSQAKSSTTSPAATAAFGTAIAVNDLLVISAGFDASGASLISGITDTYGNTYTKVTGASTNDATNGFSLETWHAKVTTAGSSNIVTATFNDAISSINYVVQHYNGFTGAPTLDQSAVALNASSTSTSSGATATTTQAIQLVVGTSVHNISASAYTAGAGYGNLTESSVANRHVAIESKPVSATGAQTATFTIAAARDSITGVATFYSAAAGGTTVVPGIATLTTTSFAPTVTVTNHKIVVPGVAALTTTTFAPTVTATNHKIVVPGVASLTTTTFAPTVTATDRKIVVPGVASLTTATFAPTVTVTDLKIMVPGVATLTTTSYAPTVFASNFKQVVPGVASLTTTTYAPTVFASNFKQVIPGTASLTTTTYAPVISISDKKIVIPGTASLTTTTYAPTVATTAHKIVIPGTATLTITRYTPTVFASNAQQFVPGTATLTTTTFAPTVTASDKKIVIPGTATLTTTTYAPTVSITDIKIVVPGTASLAITRYAPVVSISDHKIFIPGTATLTTTTYAPTILIATPTVVIPGTLVLELTTYPMTVRISNYRGDDVLIIRSVSDNLTIRHIQIDQLTISGVSDSLVIRDKTDAITVRHKADNANIRNKSDNLLVRV